MNEKSYKRLRNKYLPSKLKLIFIAESPPQSGRYFYNPEGSIAEQLFSAMMKCVLDFRPESKEGGLKEFQRQDYFLVDAVYKPVNHIKNSAERNRIILDNLENLKKDLRGVTQGKRTKIVLIKVNICRLLEKPLLDAGFNVINNGLVIPFPSHWHYRKFCQRIKRLI